MLLEETASQNIFWNNIGPCLAQIGRGAPGYAVVCNTHYAVRVSVMYLHTYVLIYIR